MSRESTPLLSTNTGPAQISRKKFVTLLGTLYFGTFLAALDSTIVSTLLASIASDLNALDSISWVATSYLVAYSAFQPLYGKLSDIFGNKRILLISTLLFGLGCQVCSMANTLPVLVTGRLINGIGAGGVLSINSITVSSYVSARERGVYQGIGNLVFGCGAAFGGVIGSLSQEYRGWRFAFGLQVPLSLLSLVVIFFNMDDLRQDDTILVEDSIQADEPIKKSSFERLDLVGSVSLATFVVLLMLTVTTGGVQFEWKSLPIALFVIGSLISGSIFVYWETHKAIEPVLPMWLLFDRTVLNTCLINFLGSGVAYINIYYVPIYLAACLDYSPNRVSKRLLAQFFGGSAGSLGAGLIMRKTGKYWWLLMYSCLGLFAASLMWIGLPLLSDSITDTWYWQDSAFLLSGISYVAILTISLVVLITAFPAYQATATSAQYTFRGSGSSILMAVAAAIFNNVLKKELNINITGKGAAKIIEKVSKSVDAIREVPEEYLPGIVESYRWAIALVFIFSSACAFLAIINAAQVKEMPLDAPSVVTSDIE